MKSVRLRLPNGEMAPLYQGYFQLVGIKDGEIVQWLGAHSTLQEVANSLSVVIKLGWMRNSTEYVVLRADKVPISALNKIKRGYHKLNTRR